MSPQPVSVAPSPSSVLRNLLPSRDAQRRLYRLRPEPLQEIDAWLAQFREFWATHVDELERYLDRMEPIINSEKEDKGEDQ